MKRTIRLNCDRLIDGTGCKAGEQVDVDEAAAVVLIQQGAAMPVDVDKAERETRVPGKVSVRDGR